MQRSSASRPYFLTKHQTPNTKHDAAFVGIQTVFSEQPPELSLIRFDSMVLRLVPNGLPQCADMSRAEPADVLTAKWITERIICALRASGCRHARFAGTGCRQATCGDSRARNRLHLSTIRFARFFQEFRHKSFLDSRFLPPRDCAL